MTRHMPRIVPLLVFLAPLILYFPVTLGLRIFFDGDFSLFYYPLRFALAQALGEGGLPFWSPGIMMGFPLVAEGQIGVLYPLNQILYRFLPAYRALGLEMLLHLGWMMLGAFCFGRQLKLSQTSAVFAALVLAGNAYVMANFLYPSVLATMAWLPWMLWFFEKLLATNLLRARIGWFTLLCGAITLQIFAAHPYHEFFGTGLLLVYASVWWWRVDSSRSRWRWWQPLAFVALAILVAIGVGAAQWLPTLELMQVSNRAKLSFDEFTIYSVEPQHLLLLVAPFSQGGIYGVPGGVVGYIGVMPLALALIAPFICRNRNTIYWSVLAIIGLGMAFGENNPIYLLLYNVPIFNSLRIADRFLYVFVLGATMAGASAYEEIIRRNFSANPTRWFRVSVLGMVTLIAVEIILAYQFSLRDWHLFWDWLSPILGLLTIVILIAVWQHKSARQTIMLAVMGITIFDLVAFAAVFLHSKNALVTMDEFVRAPQSLVSINAPSGQARVMTAGALIPPYRVAKESLFPYLGTVYDIDTTKGATSFFIRRAREYTELFSPGMLNLANVRFVVIPKFPPDMFGQSVSQPSDKFALRLTSGKIEVLPTPAQVVEIDSYVENADTSDGTELGSVSVFLRDQLPLEMPLRMGIETTYWLVEQQAGRLIPPVAHDVASNSNRGHVYRAHFVLPRNQVVVGLQFALNDDALRIEHIRLVNDTGDVTLVDYAVGASNHSLVYRSDHVSVMENADALPRAFIVHAAQIVTDVNALARMREYTFDPRASALLSSGEAMDDPSPEPRGEESVEITSYEPERVVLSVSAQRPGYVILSDVWYPGWVASVDGQPTPIHRANYAFRAVKVDAGVHKIIFEFVPTSFYVGAGISLTTVILYLIGAGYALKKDECEP